MADSPLERAITQPVRCTVCGSGFGKRWNFTIERGEAGLLYVTCGRRALEEDGE